METEDRRVLIGDDFDLDGIGFIDEGPCDLGHEGLHLRDSQLGIGMQGGIGHSYTSREFGLHQGEPLLLGGRVSLYALDVYGEIGSDLRAQMTCSIPSAERWC